MDVGQGTGLEVEDTDLATVHHGSDAEKYLALLRKYLALHTDLSPVNRSSLKLMVNNPLVKV